MEIVILLERERQLISFVFYIMFYEPLFVFMSFFICHCIVCLLIHGFWLPLWYLQTCLSVAPNEQ